MSAWATNVVSERQPDSPKTAESPLEALMPNPYIKRPFWDCYFYETIGTAMGLGFVAMLNFANKKPFLSGIQRYPIAAITGGSLLHFLKSYKEKEWAERDAILRHYVSLHPDDFPPFQRTKFGDMFEPWTPIR